MLTAQELNFIWKRKINLNQVEEKIIKALKSGPKRLNKIMDSGVYFDYGESYVRKVCNEMVFRNIIQSDHKRIRSYALNGQDFIKEEKEDIVSKGKIVELILKLLRKGPLCRASIVNKLSQYDNKQVYQTLYRLTGNAVGYKAVIELTGKHYKLLG